MSDYELSLLHVILNDLQLNPAYYSCSNESQTVSVKSPFLGGYFLVSGCLFITLYLICLFSILSSERIKTSSYKIMTVLAVYDIISLSANSVATGYFAINGLTFCENRLLFFIFGAFALGSWLGSCVTSITLAVNRCCDLNPHAHLWLLFEGKRIYVFMAVFVVYGLYGTFLSKPVIFHSQFMSWFFDPLVGTDPTLYSNFLHSANNIVVSIVTIALYIYICITIISQSHFGTSVKFSNTQKQIILQSVLICFCHTFATFIYVYMQFFPAPLFLILMAQFGWQFCNSSMCFIYLTVNRSVRNSVFGMFCSKFAQQQASVSHLSH